MKTFFFIFAFFVFSNLFAQENPKTKNFSFESQISLGFSFYNLSGLDNFMIENQINHKAPKMQINLGIGAEMRYKDLNLIANIKYGLPFPRSTSNSAFEMHGNSIELLGKMDIFKKPLGKFRFFPIFGMGVGSQNVTIISRIPSGQIINNALNLTLTNYWYNLGISMENPYGKVRLGYCFSPVGNWNLGIQSLTDPFQDRLNHIYFQSVFSILR